MCANVTDPTATTTTNLTDGGKARSLLSRLTQPLRSRTRNLADFHIKPLEPHRKYSPGDLVKGSVVLTIIKPVRITHLTVALHGFIRVYKHPNGAGDHFEPSVTSQGNSNTSKYFGNGHASLFQDEQTLCGEGRLDVGVYEFNFELEFPTKGLPSSIDFERGTISYMISATITRPTSIAPTSTCDRKVSLVETVDIGPMIPPKARNITLEPITKKTKRRASRKEKTESKSLEPGTTTITPEIGSGSDRISTPLPEESASQCGSNEMNADGPQNLDGPQSPISSHCPSEVSGGSGVSISTGLSFAHASSLRSGGESKTSYADKTITATIQMMKAGCLPGDNIPLRIFIQHTKVVKSLHGIIVTLYRQGRIDSAPPLSLFKDVKGKEAERMKHEDYYPKSKTGLGGLSLTSAGSSSVFRKDLSQTFAPLLIDPQTLSTEVKTSIRVPEDAFPTIKGVPGQMISFRYHVEVVVDLGGKLAGQDRFLPRLGISGSPATYGGGPTRVGRDDGNAAMLAALGGSIVDTDHLRRERSVVACLFEVVVGTTDSQRRRGRGGSTGAARNHSYFSTSDPLTSPLPYENNNQREPWYDENYEDQQDCMYHQNYDRYYHSAGQPGYDYPPEEPCQPYHHHNYDDYSYQHPPPTIPIPPPEIINDENLDEKTRIRRAEQRLLPSQPPTAEDDFATSAGPSSSSDRTTIGPTSAARGSTSHEDTNPASDSTPLLRTRDTSPSLRLATGQTGGKQHSTIPSAPTIDDLSLPHPAESSSNHYHPEEDKQELERRRLLNEASAPSDFPDADDGDVGEGSSNAREVHAPSAPVLTEEDEYGGFYRGASGSGGSNGQGRPLSEMLPKYER